MMTEIMFRDQARSLGLKRYITGVPCKHGHTAERFTINARCVACVRADKLALQKQKQLLADGRPGRRCRQCDQLFPLGWRWALKIHPECQADRRRASQKRNQILAKAMAALLREQLIDADRFMEGLS